MAALRWLQRELVHGHRFARQQGFVHLQVVGLHQPTVCGHPVTFRQQQTVACHDVTGRDQPCLAITQHTSLGLCELAQGLNGGLGLAFLVKTQHQHGQHENRQRQTFCQVAQQHVKQCRRDEQSEHGLAQHVRQASPHGATSALLDLIGTILGQLLVGLGCRQALCDGMVIWCHGAVCEAWGLQILMQVKSGGGGGLFVIPKGHARAHVFAHPRPRRQHEPQNSGISGPHSAAGGGH